MKYHAEIIECPKCGKIQKATVLHTEPFNSYAHECKCGFMITESDWHNIFQKENLPTQTNIK
jgi:lysyl-tRNA synthetase class I